MNEGRKEGFFTILKSNQMWVVFAEREKPEYPEKKTSRSRVENQQTQPKYDAESGNRTRDTLVEGECSHHCANPALLVSLMCVLYDWTAQ